MPITSRRATEEQTKSAFDFITFTVEFLVKTTLAFDFEPTLPLQLKGFPEPVIGYSVLNAKSHPEKLRGIEGLKARMIGREHEFDLLKSATEEWLKGKGQIVPIICEAGIGKSRLVSELKEYLKKYEGRRMTDENLELHPSSFIPYTYLEGRCVEIGQSISYWPFMDILRTYKGNSEKAGEYIYAYYHVFSYVWLVLAFKDDLIAVSIPILIIFRGSAGVPMRSSMIVCSSDKGRWIKPTFVAKWLAAQKCNVRYII